MIEKLICLGLCAVAIVFAAHFPLRDRRAAMSLAVAMLVNWIVCEWTFTPFGPQMLLWPYGIRFEAMDVWAFVDACGGLLALALAPRQAFGWALWGIAMVQVGFHQVYAWKLLEYGVYQSWLDLLFYAGVAVFLTGGSKGVGSALHSRLGGLGLYGRKVAEARAQSGG